VIAIVFTPQTTIQLTTLEWFIGFTFRGSLSRRVWITHHIAIAIAIALALAIAIGSAIVIGSAIGSAIVIGSAIGSAIVIGSAIAIGSAF